MSIAPTAIYSGPWPRHRMIAMAPPYSPAQRIPTPLYAQLEGPPAGPATAPRAPHSHPSTWPLTHTRPLLGPGAHLSPPLPTTAQAQGLALSLTHCTQSTLSS